MIYTNKEIIDFINKFKELNPIELEEIFTRGNCYYFAVILKNRFPKMNIIYAAIDNHFMCLYDNNIYDIRGNITKQIEVCDLYDWESYEEIDKEEYKRIIRDCILFKTRKDNI